MLKKSLSALILAGLFTGGAYAGTGCCQLQNGTCSVHANPTCRDTLKGTYFPFKVCAVQLKDGCVDPGSTAAPKKERIAGGSISASEFEEMKAAGKLESEYFVKLERSEDKIYVFTEKEVAALKEGATLELGNCETAVLGEEGLQTMASKAEGC